ncbi:VacJ family lipoprotein [Marinomonas piezotolerans]|uniref:VacJ family lipoprotein n=1 Tax=Marinomonas piezotolerans TaxID=2213058 RepID=A0A370UD58_9GAMM|nr:VacJ family lipoprotein [Marinomonas piezotolerans]RDL45718.1 VacJ family lipoprotein [Marinomonas piezotolerans]
MNQLVRQFLVSLGVMLSALTAIAETPEDPWEGYNRAVFSFNDTLDRYALKPAAQGYQAVTPTPVQKGVSNFFSNLGEIPNIGNNLLQGKWDETASSTFRFLINSTAGWFGIFDVASELGLQRYEEDFGQTLGYWGVSSGPYVVIPFLGSSTVRDASGLVVDYSLFDGLDLYDLSSDQELFARTLNVIQVRAKYLSAERMVFGDRYSFLRDVYLQSREGAVNDNKGRQFDSQTNQSSNSSTSEQGSWGSEADDSWGSDSSWGDETDDSWGSESSWGDDEVDSWGSDSSQIEDSWGNAN